MTARCSGVCGTAAPLQQCSQEEPSPAALSLPAWLHCAQPCSLPPAGAATKAPGVRKQKRAPGRGELAALGNMYLLQVVGDVDDLLAGDANNDLDQLLDHSRLLMDNSEVQRPAERAGWPLAQCHASPGPLCHLPSLRASIMALTANKAPTLSPQTLHVLTCLRSRPVMRPGASGPPAACGGRR